MSASSPKKSSVAFFITFLYAYLEYPFKFTKTLVSIQASDKESVILECEVDDAEATVVWKKGDEVLPLNDKK